MGFQRLIRLSHAHIVSHRLRTRRRRLHRHSEPRATRLRPLRPRQQRRSRNRRRSRIQRRIPQPHHFHHKAYGLIVSTYAGYELAASFDFDENVDESIILDDPTYWNSGAGFQPIDDDSGNKYTGDFKGNGHTMNNMFINRITTGAVSSVVSSSNDVRGMVGLMNSATPNVSVSPSYSTASVRGATNAGGLIGRAISSSVTKSYSTSLVTHSIESAPTDQRLVGRGVRHGQRNQQLLEHFHKRTHWRHRLRRPRRSSRQQRQRYQQNHPRTPDRYHLHQHLLRME